jgi:hypothetical protein
MLLPDKIIQCYHYARPIYMESAQRACQIQVVHSVAELIPCNGTAKHKIIWETLGCSVFIDHTSNWKFRGMPIAATESYFSPDLRELCMTGVASCVVPQRFSVYGPETHMILFTLPKYRDALIEVSRRFEVALNTLALRLR